MAERARLVGINHVAVEVGDVEQALALDGRLFEFEMRGRVAHMAFVDMGDQFIAISEPRSQSADDSRHFGLVVDDVTARAAVTREGLAIVGQSRRSFDFLDPWEPVPGCRLRRHPVRPGGRREAQARHRGARED